MRVESRLTKTTKFLSQTFGVGYLNPLSARDSNPNEKIVQHEDILGGHPSYYYSRSTSTLNSAGTIVDGQPKIHIRPHSKEEGLDADGAAYAKFFMFLLGTSTISYFEILMRFWTCS